ncbi:MAG: CoA transferase [Chloroflexi bacterium]|nr:CoA transferase [Chloroflexota bacterium]
MRPLHGVRVLDLTRLLPGPFCSLMLADLGADVIKIEDLLLGDYLRQGAPRVTATQGIHFMALNRNKRSLKMSVRPKEGKAVFARLVERADIVLDGFRPGRLDRMGIGYEAMSALNPRIIYCAISGYGQDGPYRDRAGHDLNYLARAGLLDLFGALGGDPLPLPVQIADLTGAYLAAIGVLAALVARATSGRGQFVDISMMDGVLPWLPMVLPQFMYDRQRVRRGETALGGGLACYNVYQCADGEWLALGALEPQFWATFCKMIDREDLNDRRQDIGEAAAPTIETLRTLFRSKTRAEWLAFFGDADVCVDPVQTLAEAVEDPHLRARGMFAAVEYPQAGTIMQVASPLKLSGSPVPRLEPSPESGEHTEVILREAGYDDAALAELRAKKVIE